MGAKAADSEGMDTDAQVMDGERTGMDAKAADKDGTETGGKAAAPRRRASLSVMAFCPHAFA